MSRRKPLLLAALAAICFLPLAQACSAQSPALTVSPATAAKLRGLLPFPEATLDPKIELTIGLFYLPDQGYTLFRQSSDYAAQIVQTRRTLMGSITDAARERRLGNLYHAAGLPGKSKAAFRQSEEICQETLRREPNNGLALAEYGRALEASGQAAAAEAYLRKAVQTAPHSADVWMALGYVLDTKSAPATESAKHYARNAEAAYDRAVSLAPHNPSVWIARGEFRTWDLPQAHGQLISRDGLADYEQAAALTPNDPYAQAMVATVDCFTFEQAHHMFTSLKAAKMEPPSSDHRAEAILRHVTAIAQSKHGKQPAAAYTARAWVQYEFFHDSQGAQKSLRLALNENPSEQDAIDYQLHVLSFAHNDSLVAAACRRELRRRPQIYLRVLLADADSRLAQQKPRYWGEAREQMALAHDAAPHDDAFRLGLATLLLKSGQAADLSRADVLLSEIAPSAPGRSKAQQADYDLTCGVSAALASRPEEARVFLARALQDDPHIRPAHSVLVLL